MINLYEFEYAGKIKLTDIDDNVFVGEALDVTDADDQGDNQKQIESLTINTSDGLIDFYADEIKTIEKCSVKEEA